MTPALPVRVLLELGRTEGGPEALRLLRHDQHTRRLLLLRAVLDASEDAPAALCPPGTRSRLRDDWALLEAAERSGPAGRAAVRDLVCYPLAGSWAHRCLSDLTGPAPSHAAARSLAHFSALAAAAAIRAGVTFSVRLAVHGGLLVLPTLGALSLPVPDGTPVAAAYRRGVLRLRRPGERRPVAVHPQTAFGAWSEDARWLPLHALPGLLPQHRPVPLDDLHPYRIVRAAPAYDGLDGATRLDEAERKRWLQVWSGTADLLRLGGEHRVAETGTLLSCLVPLDQAPGSGVSSPASVSRSGTRREAAGAVFSSTPATPEACAATLLHELHHSKLAAVCELVRLHDAGPEPRHFAPWRPDPRPFDGLWQGAYSHLALADFWQRVALATRHAPRRELAWAEHARCREQVGAVLPVLVGSAALTLAGRQFADQMVVVYTRMAENPPPKGQLARAAAYVATARALWLQRHGTPHGG